MLYLIISNIIINLVTLCIVYKKVEYSKVVKIDPYKDYRDPKTGLLKARKVNSL